VFFPQKYLQDLCQHTCSTFKISMLSSRGFKQGYQITLKGNCPKCRTISFLWTIKSFQRKNCPITGATIVICPKQTKVNNRPICRRKFVQSGHPGFKLGRYYVHNRVFWVENRLACRVSRWVCEKIAQSSTTHFGSKLIQNYFYVEKSSPKNLDFFGNFQKNTQRKQ
jgi:hypothetical protein